MDFYPFDDEYVRRLIAGDRETCAHFSAYFNEFLLIKLRKRLDSKQSIDDVRQEVFLRVLAKLPELQDGHKLGSFVNSFCNHVLMEWYRVESKSDQFARAQRIDDATKTTIEDELLSEERRLAVRRVIDRLKPREASILRALFLEEGTKDDVCEQFGVDRKYLRVLLHRAKEHFRSAFPPGSR